MITAWETESISLRDIEEPYDIGILLSGYARNPNFLLNDDYFFELGGGVNRLTQTIELYRLGKIKKILISGGSATILTKTVSESENTKVFLIRLGIPESDILIESKSRNTYENALYTKEFLDQENLQGQKLLLITSAFHIFRAEKCFKKVGLNVTSFSVDFHGRTLFFHPEDLIPSTGAIEDWKLLIKEWIGIAVYRLKDYL